MSIARAHMHRTMAAKQSAASTAGATPEPGSLAEKMAHALSMHMAALKQIKSRTAKIEAKRDMLPDYAAYVDGVLAAGNGGQDDVLVTIMVWRLDTGDYDGALAIAAYAIRHGLGTPVTFSRDVPATLLEEMADAALVNGLDDAARAAMVAPLSTAMDLTEGCDMPDEVRAKAHKAMGLGLKDEDPAEAAEHLRIALKLDPKCGVKAELNRLEKHLAGEQSGP